MASLKLSLGGGKGVIARNAAFGVFTLYLCHVIFFSILGMGWIIGGGSDVTVTPGISMPTRFRAIPFGGHWLHLKNGQKVEVVYSADIQEGAMVPALKPAVWLMGIGAARGYGEPITESGSGTVSVAAPADGWYTLVASSRNTLTPEEIKDRPLIGPRRDAAFDYNLRWRVID